MSLSVAVTRYELPFRAPVTTARGTVHVRRGFVVRVVNSAGAGYGEVATWPGFGSQGQIDEALGELQHLHLPERPLAHADEAQAFCDKLALPVELRAGLATALLDLSARQRGVPLATFLGRSFATTVPVGALASSGEDAAARIGDGVRTLKVKIGAADVAHDIARVREVVAVAGPAARVRVDANQAYEPSVALDVCAALARLGVEYVEEPLREPTPEALATLRARTAVKIALDEALGRDPGRFLDPACCDVFVLKPSFLGGPLAAVQLALRARAAGLGVSVGTAFESAVGRATALHVAALCAADRAAGLLSPLGADVAEMPAVIGGSMALPVGSGLGVTPRLGGWS